jgi:uncharacterized membrane protein YkvA (DUF1232 family)
MTTDIQNFIVRGSQKLTPAQIAQFRENLPLVMAKVEEADPSRQPNLEEQTRFLVRYVEDCLDDKHQPVDVAALAEALFALMYLERGMDIIPDSVPEIGFSDDSAVLRTVIGTHETEFKGYCKRNGLKFSDLPTAA